MNDAPFNDLLLGLPRSNAELFARSCAVIPGGVNSSIRAFKAVGGTPYIVERAEGPYVYDVEGTRYIDLVQSYGAIILGHAHHAVTAAIGTAAAGGTSYGAPTPGELLLAEEISRRVPSCERVRLMNSGTEATSTAVRLARGFTGRDRIVIFHGNFHGATDALLAAGGSGVATLGLAGTAGVPVGAVANTLVVPYNVVPQLDEQVAAVFVEPVAANMGVVAPAPGFLEGLRAECDRVGALLVFDEVITGFRLGTGGAQELFGVRADLTTFGKVIGGGLPIGCVGGRRDIMETLSPLGPVFHAGTLAGNPLATAAGRAALAELTPEVYALLRARAARLSGLLTDACTAAGLPATFPVVGTLVGMYFGSGPAPTNFQEAKTTDESVYRAFFHAMLAEGVALAPGAYEALFVGLAHTDEVLAAIGVAAGRAALVAAAARTTGGPTPSAVRQFFTLRFWLTVLALGGLALGVAAFARSRDSKADGSGEVGAASADRTIDLISWVYAVQPPPGFEIVDGRTTTDLALILDGTRTMIVKAGTPGEVHCPQLTELAQCTVAADLLGDGVLWFSIVPGLPGATVQLPAVTQLLDGGWVRLANGWVVRHAPKVERSCAEASSSLNDFISTYGPDATSTFSFDQQELIKVTCPKTPGESTTTTSVLSVTDPGVPLDPTATSIDPATVDTGEAG